MDRKIIASELYKIAKELLADTDYIYDPEHKKHPSGGYVKTEKGWTKNKKDEHGEKPSGDSKKTSPKTEMTDEQKKLDKMADDKDERIRSEVSLNPNTSSKTLDKLSNDSEEFIRSRVANNSNTSPGLKRLSQQNILCLGRKHVGEIPLLAETSKKRKLSGGYDHFFSSAD